VIVTSTRSGSGDGAGSPPDGARRVTDAELAGGLRLETGRRHVLVVPSAGLQLTGPAERILWITHQGTPDHGPLMPDASGFRVVSAGAGVTPSPGTSWVWTARLTYRTLEFEPQTHIVEYVAGGQGSSAPPDLFRRAAGRIVQAGDHRAESDADRVAWAAGGDLVIRVQGTARIGGRDAPLDVQLSGYQILAGDNPPYSALRSFLRRVALDAARRTRVLPQTAGPGDQTITLTEQDGEWLASILCVETDSHGVARQFRLDTRAPRLVRGKARRSDRIVSGTLQLVIKGHPVMNGTGDGGGGIGQITNPAPGPTELWDWRANARAAFEIYCSKARLVSVYVRSVRRRLEGSLDSSPYDVVLGVNRHRRARGLPPLSRIEVPLLTPRQMRDDMARGYMGYLNPRDHPGQLGLGWHEYRLATEGEGGRLRVDHVRAEAGRWVGTAVWVQVEETERPGQWRGGVWVPRFGKPNYVRAMHAAPCAGGQG
jgi:hypothetical protein